MARLKAPSVVAGKRHRCPRCQLVFEVPQQTQATVQDNGYALRLEGDSTASREVYIPVICTVCHTRMYGTLEQVGQELICP